MEGRRRRQLTPLSGELSTGEWAPAPAEKPRKERKEKPAPTTRMGLIVQGLGRFALIAAALAAGTALVALAIVWLAGASATRTFPRAFYFAGAFLGAVAVLGGMGTYDRMYRTRPEQELAVSKSFVYAAFAIALIAIGVLLEFLL